LPVGDYIAKVAQSNPVLSVSASDTAVNVNFNGTSVAYGGATVGNTGTGLATLKPFAGMNISSVAFTGGSHLITESLTIGTLSLTSSTVELDVALPISTVSMVSGTLNIDANPSNSPDLSIASGTVYLRATTAPTFDDLTVGDSSDAAAVLTGIAYTGTWNAAATPPWSTAPGPGNGRIELTATNITVNSDGKINADVLGYPGSGGHGYSYDGIPGTGGGRLACDEECAGGGASYGTLGTSGWIASPGLSTFGSSDFATELYLGSSGGMGGTVSGRGGGAIMITANSISVYGAITANGGAGGTNAGGGSGGTIVIVATPTFDTFGTGNVKALGGAAGGGNYGGGAGGKGRIRVTENSVVQTISSGFDPTSE
jgi:hypothetical protein